MIAVRTGLSNARSEAAWSVDPSGVDHFRARQIATNWRPYFHALCPRSDADWLAACTMRGLGTLRMHGPALPAPTSDGSDSVHAPAFPRRRKSCNITGKAGSEPCCMSNQHRRICKSGPLAEESEAWH